MDRARTLNGIQAILAEFPGLQCTEGSDHLYVGSATAPKTITLEDRGDRGWEVSTDAGHIHVFDDSEAADQVKWLLTGADRFVSEYRGQTLMAQWTESWDGNAYQQAGGLAIYGSIIDADEWKLWPGETWRQVATQLRVVDGEVERHTSEIQGENTSFEPFAWMLEMLGPAPEGLKWTVGAIDPSFFYLAPIGWRQLGKHDGFRDVAPSEEPDLLLRCRIMYREAEKPNSNVPSEPIHARLSQYFFTPEADGWSKHEWRLEYGVDEYDALAVLECFYLKQQDKEVEPIRVLLEEHISKSVFLLPNG